MKLHLAFCFLTFLLYFDFGGCNDVPHEVVNMYFYSRSNLDTAILLRSHNLSDIFESNFNPEVSTYLVGHGAWNNHSSCLITKDSLLTAGDFNILLVDYMEPASAGNTYNDSVGGVGLIVADYVTLLVNHFGLSYDNFTFVGFSLGGLVCGSIGLYLNGELREIVGLDTGSVDGYLTASSAKFVQNIHSSSVSTSFPYGHSNYYVNTNEQPGCDEDIECNHFRAMRYYEESLVSGGFTAYKCNSSESYAAGLCDENETSYLGRVELDKIANGSYYLKTNSESPFSMDSSSSNITPVRNLKLLWLILFSFIFLKK